LPRGAARAVTRSGLLDLTHSSELIGPTRRVSAARPSLVNDSASEASCASFCRTERRACAGYAWRSTADTTVAECYLIARSESRGAVCSPPRLRSSAGVRGICGGGIVSDDESACCAVACGRCGGSGCGALPGGPRNCCTQRIIATASCCSGGGGPPCVVSEGTGNGVRAADASTNSDPLRSSPPPPLLPPMPLPPLPPLLPCEALSLSGERLPYIADATAPPSSKTNAVTIPPPAARGVWRVRSAAQRAADLAAALAAADDDVSPDGEAVTSTSAPGRMLSSAAVGGGADDASDAMHQSARFVLVTVSHNGNRACSGV
jgi:hypothetical protein